MYHPTIFFNPAFVVNVIAGWILTVLGALVLLVAAIWFMLAHEWAHSPTRPTAWRALCTLGIAMFVGGCVWQFAGYFRVGGVTW
jgi:predicted phage tail protein